jgi:hypothetical protein
VSCNAHWQKTLTFFLGQVSSHYSCTSPELYRNAIFISQTVQHAVVKNVHLSTDNSWRFPCLFLQLRMLYICTCRHFLGRTLRTLFSLYRFIEIPRFALLVILGLPRNRLRLHHIALILTTKCRQGSPPLISSSMALLIRKTHRIPACLSTKNMRMAVVEAGTESRRKSY